MTAQCCILWFYFTVVVSRSFGSFFFFGTFEGKRLPLGPHGQGRAGRSSSGAAKCECAVIEDVVERRGVGCSTLCLGLH
jgi:hypothetical protein